MTNLLRFMPLTCSSIQMHDCKDLIRIVPTRTLARSCIRRSYSGVYIESWYRSSLGANPTSDWLTQSFLTRSELQNNQERRQRISPPSTHPPQKQPRKNSNHRENEAPHPELPLLRPQDLQNQPSSLPSPPQRSRTRTSRSRDQPTAHPEHAAETELGSPEDDFTRGIIANFFTTTRIPFPLHHQLTRLFFPFHTARPTQSSRRGPGGRRFDDRRQ